MRGAFVAVTGFGLVAALVIALAALGPCAHNAAVTSPGDASSDPTRGTHAGAATAVPTPSKPATARRPPRKGLRAGAAPGAVEDDAAAADGDPDHVRGVVVDAEQRPVPGARVALHPCDTTGRYVAWAPVVDLTKVLAACETDAEGRFVLATPAVPAIVRATKDGFVPAAQDATPDESPTLKLVRGTERRFRVVVDGSDLPIAGARLVLTDDGRGPPRAASVTDADGSATLVTEDGARIIVSAEGYATETVTARVDPPDAVTVDLHEGSAAAGLVVDTAGRPLAGALVRLAAEESDGGGRVTTGTSGAFRFEGLYPAALENVVEASLDGWTTERADIRPGDLDARIVLRRTATIRGVVVFESGKPVAYAMVGGSVQTDEQGRFEWTSAPPGRCWVTAERTSWGVFRDDDTREDHEGATLVDVAEGGVVEDVRVVLAPVAETASAIVVRVTDAEGAPVRGACVTAFDEEEQVAAWLTPDDGTVHVRVSSPPGTRLRLVASGPGDDRTVTAYAWSAETVATRSSREARDDLVNLGLGKPSGAVELRLGRPARIVLSAVDTEGGRVRLDRVCVEDARYYLDPPADGVFEIPGSKWVSIALRAPGFGERHVLLSPPHPPVREVTVRFAAAARVVGRVLDADGQPAAGCGVAVRVTGVDQAFSTSVTTDATGRFAAEGLPPGSARLRVHGDAEVVLVATVAVAAGATADAGDLRIVAPETVEGQVVDPAGRGVGFATLEVVESDADDASAQTWTSAADGSFAAALPRRAGQRLRVTRPGFATRWFAVDGAPRPLRIALAPACRILVRAPKRLGAGTPSVTVRVAGDTSPAWVPRYVDVADTAGAPGDWLAFRCEDLPAGRTDVVLRVGRRTFTRTVDVVAGRTAEVVFDE